MKRKRLDLLSGKDQKTNNKAKEITWARGKSRNGAINTEKTKQLDSLSEKHQETNNKVKEITWDMDKSGNATLRSKLSKKTKKLTAQWTKQQEAGVRQKQKGRLWNESEQKHKQIYKWSLKSAQMGKIKRTQEIPHYKIR